MKNYYFKNKYILLLINNQISLTIESDGITSYNGLDNGKKIVYYENGKMLFNTSYFNDLKHGKDIDYYENGDKLGEVDYQNGQIHGKYIQYFNNGNRMEREYKYDERIT